MSFRLKTIIGIALIQTAFFLFLIVMVLNFVESAQNREITERAHTTMNMFAATTRDAILSSDLATLESAAAEILENPGIMYVRIFDANLELMTSSNRESTQQHIFSEDTNLQDALIDGIFDIEKSIEIDNTPLGKIQLGLSTSRLLSEFQVLRNYSLSVAGFEILLMILFSFILGNWLTHRLILLKRAAESIGEGELGVQLKASGSDEIAHTINAFNSMSSKLQTAELQRKKTMERLEEAEKQSRLLLTSAAEGIFGIDNTMRISFANPAAARMLEFKTPESMIDTPLAELFDECPQNINHIQQCLNSGDSIHIEDSVFHTLEKNSINIEYTCSAIKKDLTVTGAVIIFNDITRRKEAEAAIHRAHHSELEHAQKKADFMSNMSHELLTPLNGVIGLLQLIDKNTLSENYAQFISGAQDSANNLLHIINNILDFINISSDKHVLESIDFNIKKTIHESIKRFQPEAESKGLVIKQDINLEHNWVKGDPQRLQQVINSLLDNAIKFTQKGGVCVSVKCLEDTEELINLQFSVTDTGIGIPTEQQQQLFTSFQQADTSSTREYGGVGIGLSICQNLIKKMGGQITLESNPGKGSNFSFNLQFIASSITEVDDSEPPRQVSKDVPQYNAHVLLVDDNPVNQMVSSKLCKKYGITFKQAMNGQQALDEFAQANFDLIFMDLQMPVMNGLEATRHIREHEPEQTHQTIIALSANSTDEDRHQCSQVGIDDFISKPLKTHDMELVLERWLGDKRAN